MIAAPPNVLAEMTGAVRRPCYLLHIELDKEYFLSTRQITQWRGKTYERGLVTLNSINATQGTFTLVNSDFQFTQGALTGAFQRKAVKIYIGYVDEDRGQWLPADYVAENYEQAATNDAPMLVFEGTITAITNVGETLTVTVSRASSARYPTVRILPPLANHITPEGAVIAFGGQNYVIKRRKD